MADRKKTFSFSMCQWETHYVEVSYKVSASSIEDAIDSVRNDAYYYQIEDSENLIDVTEIDLDYDSLRNTTPEAISLSKLYNPSEV